MSVVLLVRHGQASWGTDDYDRLSPLGEEQGRGLRPDVVVHGSLLRQRQTARFLVQAATWGSEPSVHAGWDEFDHDQVLHRTPHAAATSSDPADFQAWFEAATERWVGGEFDTEYDESFPSFGERVAATLRELTQDLPRSGVAVVVTSGGPISATVAALLGGDAGVFRRLSPVVVNTSVTKLVVGRRGTSLVSFNDHSHLEAAGPGLLTYR
jgi:broad specificity phosphatase PhoE